MRKPNAICEGCKNPFYSRPSAKLNGWGRYCKHSCYIASKYGERPKTKTCLTCGCTFNIKRRKKKKYCSQSCAAKSSNRGRVGIKYESDDNFKKRLVRKYGTKCAVCGYNISVDAHHIEYHSKGGSDHLENGILLCPNHHREVHLKIITKEELFIYKKKADEECCSGNVPHVGL